MFQEDTLHAYSSEIEDAVAKLLHCHRTCLGMAMTHCVEMGGEHARPQHLRLMLDCAQVCATTADFLLRKSQFHTQVAALCADICDTCAADCGQVGQMEESEAACRACAQACRVVARLEHAELLGMAAKLPPS
jgi:hypothetical protein